VAVTGSNGKSTAVKWIHEMLVRAGLKAAIGGNYGIPACEVVLEHPTLDWLVLEVSSFQLETVQKFYAEVAVLLNVLPNHLNRHGTMECYRRIKEQIFAHAPADATGIVPHQLLADRNPNQLNWVSFGAAKKADFFYHDGQIFHRNQPVLDLRDTLFSGHTLGSCTGAAVAAVAAACSIPFSVVEATARAFKPLPHRLQRLGSRDGVEYVNDSKATNLAAMAAGLEACGKSIHLIAGGVPKESDYTFLKEILAERVQSIYLVGQVSRTMYRAWNLVCPCIECGTVKTAFITARKAAQAGETILLSPGCASFDQFRNFEERGAHFMALFNGRDME
jgi:UDP-N-acetylmuramoylalanine--D-glutamate ligase